MKHVQHLSLKSKDLFSKINLTLCQRIFSHWAHVSSLRSKLNKFSRRRDIRLQVLYFGDWRFVFAQFQRCHVFYFKMRVHKFFKACQRHQARQSVLKLLENKVLENRNLNIRSKALRHWIICGRGILLATAHETRLSRNLLHRWRSRLQLVFFDLPRLQNQFIADHSLNLVHYGFQRWKGYRYKKEFDLIQAQKLDQFFIARRFVFDWISRLVNIQKCQEESDLNRKRFLAKRALHVWKRKTRKKKVARWGQTRKFALLQTCFSIWLFNFRTRRRSSALTALFNQVTTKHRRACALRVWVHRFEFWASQERIACELFQKKSRLKVLKVWSNHHHFLGHLIEKSSFVIQGRCHASAKAIMGHWLHQTRVRVSGQKRLDSFLLSARQSALVLVWERWKDLIRWRKLYPIERNFTWNRDRELKIKIISVWISRSKSIDLIRTSRWNILQSSLRIWINLARANQIYQRLNRYRDTTILKMYFSTWFKKFVNLKTLKIISRFQINSNLQQNKAKYQLGRGWLSNKAAQEEETSSTTFTTTDDLNDSSPSTP